jgi:hypothetical protein
MVDSAGNEIARFNKPVEPAELVAAMKRVPAASTVVGMN